jgi:hypothetical protein
MVATCIEIYTNVVAVDTKNVQAFIGLYQQFEVSMVVAIVLSTWCSR